MNTVPFHLGETAITQVISIDKCYLSKTITLPTIISCTDRQFQDFRTFGGLPPWP